MRLQTQLLWVQHAGMEFFFTKIVTDVAELKHRTQLMTVDSATLDSLTTHPVLGSGKLVLHCKNYVHFRQSRRLPQQGDLL